MCHMKAGLNGPERERSEKDGIAHNARGGPKRKGIGKEAEGEDPWSISDAYRMGPNLPRSYCICVGFCFVAHIMSVLSSFHTPLRVAPTTQVFTYSPLDVYNKLGKSSRYQLGLQTSGKRKGREQRGVEGEP